MISILNPGVPKLKRSELEVACEDFSNVIGTSTIGTVYKGTLSSGVEIAVASLTVTSAKDWSKNLEAQFRKKVFYELIPVKFLSVQFDQSLIFDSCYGFRLRCYRK